VVSTATKALQHQLLRKELPAVAAAMKGAGLRPPTYALLKGRSNYLCQARHDNVLKEGIALGHGPMHDQVVAWRNTTATGDLEDLPIPRPPFWTEIASDGVDCHRKSCKYADQCFYFRAKERVQGVDILVVNHHLLWANIASRGAVFDMDGRVLVLDEAHNVERSMMDAFGVNVTRHRVRYNLRAVERRAADLEQYLRDARDNADRFFDNLPQNRTLHSHMHAPSGYVDLMADLESLTNLVAANPAEAVNKLEGMLEKLYSDLAHFYDPPLDSHAYAVEDGNPPSLKSWLVSPGEVFREKILERDGATLVTSATLAVGRSFEYPRKRLGFEKFGGPVAEFMGREIFDYKRNSLCYVADDLPAPRGGAVEAHTRAVISRTIELVRASRGRALVLLATHKALRAFAEGGFNDLVGGYPVKYQGDDGPPGQLVEWLKETSGGVVVGTRSFWEGVDVSGENLSLVVIDKTPFPVPTDPLIVKLTELAEDDGGNGFMDVCIPAVQVAVQQGAGRLIRNTTDRGVIALLDPRIANKSWGRLILNALPRGVPVTTSLPDVAAFFGDAEAA
jgi:ATP-dependent DNA helicase DinG